MQVIFFLVPPRLTQSGHPYTFTTIDDITQQTRCRRRPPNKMPSYDRYQLVKTVLFLTDLLTLTYGEQSTQVGKRSSFYFLLKYLCLVGKTRLSHILITSCLRMNDWNWQKVIFSYLLTYLHRFCERTDTS